MLRTCMGTEGLIDVFKRLNKQVTKDNAHTLAAYACASPEIFMAPAVPPYHMYMVGDVAAMWAATRNVSQYTVYYRLACKTIAQYDVATLSNPDALKAIFDALDDIVNRIRTLLNSEGFPDLEY